MKKKEMAEKQETLAFTGDSKESLKERLYQLMGRRSVRQAAQDWGLPFSTLNNYLTKGTEPSLKNIQQIANKEQVSLMWIASGETGDLAKVDGYQAKASVEKAEQPNTSGYQTLQVVWDNLDKEERSKLVHLLGRKGADVLSLLLNEDALSLLQLSGDSRKAAVLLENLPPERIREILAECHRVTETPSVSVEHKKAV